MSNDHLNWDDDDDIEDGPNLDDDNPGCEECGEDATVKYGGKHDPIYLCDVCAEFYDSDEDWS